MLRALLLSTAALVPATSARPDHDRAAVAPATSTPSSPTTDVSPLETLNGLLTTPFPDELVPDGFAEPVVEPWLDYTSDDDLVGTVGGAVITFGDGFAAPQIAYIVYPDDDTSAELLSTMIESDEVDVTTTDGLAGDIRVLANFEGEYVICAETVGAVLVVGSNQAGPQGLRSTVPGDELLDDACALTDVGLVHLETATANGAGFATVPEPAPTPLPIDQLNALLTGAVDPVELPAGSAGDAVLAEYGQSVYAGSVGAVRVPVDDGNVSELIVVVFAEPDSANAWLTENEIVSTVTDDRPSGWGRQVEFEIDDGTPGCTESVRNIVVVGIASVSSTDPDDVCADVTAAAAHLAAAL